jgi:hypothetical protein
VLSVGAAMRVALARLMSRAIMLPAALDLSVSCRGVSKQAGQQQVQCKQHQVM